MLAAMSKTSTIPDAFELMCQAVAFSIGKPVHHKLVQDVAWAFLALLSPPKHNAKAPCPIVYAIQLRFAEMHVRFEDGAYRESAVGPTFRR